MRHLRINHAPHPQAARLLERRTTFVRSVRDGDRVPLGPHVLYAHSALPLLIPDPLPKEQIASEFVPGR